MAEKFYTILTNTGKAKIANALPTGTKVNLTKMKIGDGNGQYYNPSESQTELVHKVYECDITSIEVDESNPNWITITAAIPSDVGGFSIREVGVFDDSNSLIAIGKYPETYKPVASDGSVKELYIKMTLEVVNASSVELKIDPTIILATKKDIANINIKVEDVTTQLKEKVDKINKIDFKMISTTITGSSVDDKYYTSNVLNHISQMNIDIALIVMVNISTSTDSNPSLIEDVKVNNYINKFKENNINIKMLKPHLGINWSDGFNRAQYSPDNINTFFNNWKNIMLHYAEMCYQNNIPILCIGTEQEKNTAKEYSTYWKDIYDTIKSKYPFLILTYAMNYSEWRRDLDGIKENVDLLGMNVYLQWNTQPYNSNMTWKDIIYNFYNSYSPLKNGTEFVKRANELCKKFNKEILITEIGLVPTPNGLISLLPKDYLTIENYNYDIPKIVYEALFNLMLNENNFKGFAIWSISTDFFNIFKLNEVSLNSCENMIKKFCEVN